MPPLRFTAKVASAPSVTVFAVVSSAAVNGSSSSIVPVAVDVPRLTPCGPVTAVSFIVNVSSASFRVSSSVVTSIVLLVCLDVNVSVPLASV